MSRRLHRLHHNAIKPAEEPHRRILTFTIVLGQRSDTVRARPRTVCFLSKSSIPSPSLSLKTKFSPSVFVPDIKTADELPVVVFIHGGGYEYRSHSHCAFIDNFRFRYKGGNISLYPQADLVTESQNHAIAVFMQYRLGAFGKVC